MEHRVLESSKMADLGIIGSSIAHELNNPLGAILSFTQLLQGVIKNEESMLRDIKAMEEATLRCRDIVQNLLSFARPPSLEEFEKVNLKETIRQAVQMSEIQSRSSGFKISVVLPNDDIFLKGQASLLCQAIYKMIQKSLQTLEKEKQEKTSFKGEVFLELKKQKDKIELTLADSSGKTWIEPNQVKQDLDLAVVYDIISDHKGELTFLSGLKACLSFECPELF